MYEIVDEINDIIETLTARYQSRFRRDPTVLELSKHIRECYPDLYELYIEEKEYERE